MSKSTDEKSLVNANGHNLFYKIKNFFAKFFTRKYDYVSSNNDEGFETANLSSNVKLKNSFIESMKPLKEESIILNLQKDYERGKVNLNDISEEQMKKLIQLYKVQISTLENSNERRKEKLMQNKQGQFTLQQMRNKHEQEILIYKLQRQYEDGNLKISTLSKQQIEALINLYKKQINEISESNEKRKEKLLQYRKKLQIN